MHPPDEPTWPRLGLIESDARGRVPVEPSRLVGPLALVLIVALVAAVAWGVSRVEGIIQTEAPELLLEAGIDPDDLRFRTSYRDLTVEGTLPYGVTVDDVSAALDDLDDDRPHARRVVVAAVERPPPSPGEIDVSVIADGETIVLTGILPAEEHRSALVSAAEATRLSVIDNLTVSGLEPAATDPGAQVARLAGLLLTLSGAESADLRLGDTGDVSGTVRAFDGAAAAAIRASSGAAVTVTTPDVLGELAVQATYDGTRIVLTGRVFDRSQSAELARSAAAAVGAENVVNNLSLIRLDPAEPGAADKVSALALILRTFGSLIAGDATLDDTDVTLTADADSEIGERVVSAALARATNAGLRPGGVIRVLPAAATAEEQVELLQAELDALATVITATIVFAPGSAELDAGAVDALDAVAEAMAAYPLPGLAIDGHTDSVGPADVNLDISQLRADAVRAALIGRGVGEARVAATGFGETVPIAENDTEAGRRQNRRVELRAVGGG